MKKILFVFLAIFFVSPFAMADSIYDSRGSVTSGKIEGVGDGLIQINNNRNLITFIRREPSPVYKDSVEARTKLFSKNTIKYSGYVIYADNASVRMLCEDSKVSIPRYKVKNIEMYIP